MRRRLLIRLPGATDLIGRWARWVQKDGLNQVVDHTPPVRARWRGKSKTWESVESRGGRRGCAAVSPLSAVSPEPSEAQVPHLAWLALSRGGRARTGRGRLGGRGPTTRQAVSQVAGVAGPTDGRQARWVRNDGLTQVVNHTLPARGCTRRGGLKQVTDPFCPVARRLPQRRDGSGSGCSGRSPASSRRHGAAGARALDRAAAAGRQPPRALPPG